MFGMTLFVIGIVALMVSARRTFEEMTEVDITGEGEDDGDKSDSG